ncbi:MAG: hypothetical protein QNJ60_18185 [Xenococcaceae cyanobacterium MO_188.B19]|nr:hypothetical protein [Xenococcaceae cyanobacterium MO_188.B19]
METIAYLKLWIIVGILTVIAGFGYLFIHNLLYFIDGDMDPEECISSLENNERVYKELHPHREEEFYEEMRQPLRYE